MPDPPVIVGDGSIIIEIDQPLETDGSGPAKRPHKYKRKKGNEDVHIRRVVIPSKGFDQNFSDGECQIEIYYEPKPPGSGSKPPSAS